MGKKKSSCLGQLFKVALWICFWPIGVVVLLYKYSKKEKNRMVNTVQNNAPLQQNNLPPAPQQNDSDAANSPKKPRSANVYNDDFSFEFLEYDYVVINKKNKEYFDGNIKKKCNGYYILEGYIASGTKEAVAFMKPGELLIVKSVDYYIENSIIFPSGNAVVFFDEKIMIFSNDSVYTRLFPYSNSSERILCDYGCAVVEDEYEFCNLICISFESFNVWRKRISYKDMSGDRDMDDLAMKQRDNYIELKTPYNEVHYFDFQGNEVEV